MKDSTKRGIYLVANRRSEQNCLNLIYTIRTCGCNLPIRIIPYGGEQVRIDKSLKDVELCSLSDFGPEAGPFVEEISRRIPQAPPGLLRRYWAWFGDFDQFLYSDNDVVALMDWEHIFSYLDLGYEIVHADTDYMNGGVYDYFSPSRFEELMGPGALGWSLCSGHYVCQRQSHQASDLLQGLAWMEAHPGIVRGNDQTLLNVTLALKKWSVLNLCKPPYNWACSWAGSYSSILDLIKLFQVSHQRISHLHYAGAIGTGSHPIDELLFTSLPIEQREKLMRKLLAKEVVSSKFWDVIYWLKREPSTSFLRTKT